MGASPRLSSGHQHVALPWPLMNPLSAFVEQATIALDLAGARRNVKPPDLREAIHGKSFRRLERSPDLAHRRCALGSRTDRHSGALSAFIEDRRLPVGVIGP
jgi:hypothetical protein